MFNLKYEKYFFSLLSTVTLLGSFNAQASYFDEDETVNLYPVIDEENNHRIYYHNEKAKVTLNRICEHSLINEGLKKFLVENKYKRFDAGDIININDYQITLTTNNKKALNGILSERTSINYFWDYLNYTNKEETNKKIAQSLIKETSAKEGTIVMYISFFKKIIPFSKKRKSIPVNTQPFIMSAIPVSTQPFIMSAIPVNTQPFIMSAIPVSTQLFIMSAIPVNTQPFIMSAIPLSTQPFIMSAIPVSTQTTPPASVFIPYNLNENPVRKNRRVE
jgi:hypothetical protein